MATLSRRVEQDESRARMRAVRMSHDEIAIEFARRAVEDLYLSEADLLGVLRRPG